MSWKGQIVNILAILHVHRRGFRTASADTLVGTTIPRLSSLRPWWMKRSSSGFFPVCLTSSGLQQTLFAQNDWFFCKQLSLCSSDIPRYFLEFVLWISKIWRVTLLMLIPASDMQIKKEMGTICAYWNAYYLLENLSNKNHTDVVDWKDFISMQNWSTEDTFTNLKTLNLFICLMILLDVAVINFSSVTLNLKRNTYIGHIIGKLHCSWTKQIQVIEKLLTFIYILKWLTMIFIPAFISKART